MTSSGIPPSKHTVSSNPAAQTPMMRQYLDAKSQHEDCIVLFRMGDFYETFFDDAIEVARLLELTLTSRNKAGDDPIPMAGVPHHALWTYLPRLLEAGRRVAICDQVEEPSQAKGLVKREVVQVVTPGVVLDDQVLEGPRNNFLAALRVGAADEPIGIAWVDASTGERRGAVVPDLERAIGELGRIEPAELILCGFSEEERAALATRVGSAVLSPCEPPPSEEGGPLADADAMLDAYLQQTRIGSPLPIKALEIQDLDSTLRLGPDAVRNLELLRTLQDGRRKGSVLGLMDHTRTAMGGRRLKQWLLYPLTSTEAISERQDMVEALVNDPIARSTLRDDLQGVYDLERLITRIVAGNATPRDVEALASSLELVVPISERLAAMKDSPLARWTRELDPVEEAVNLVRAAIVDAPPPSLKDGGVIREGFHPELDELLVIARDGKAWFNAYAETLKEQTGISSLKVRFNQVFGYFIEVTKANLHSVPDTWLRKQTLANAERYYTPELKDREEKVLGAHDRRIALEVQLFERVRLGLAELTPRIQGTADGLASLDVFASMAELAQKRGYVRPDVGEDTRLRIVAGRHPVIEALVPPGEFVPNDVDLSTEEQQILIITGPNMAGKSTVMRQVALIVVMGQMGSFVPADHAHIGVVDQVFTRVGASDNLARGQSTFMVEMNETSTILHEATSRSLVILDEIGRGTSTYDGVSIAWSVAEYLHDQVGARTLFATHYHELTELAATRDRIVNRTIAVKEWQDDIVFLRQLVPGGTSRSYGIQVARLAGLPDGVLARAREVLKRLEQGALERDARSRVEESESPVTPGSAGQLSLFGPHPDHLRVLRTLEGINPDDLTPREAQALLYELRELVDQGSS